MSSPPDPDINALTSSKKQRTITEQEKREIKERKARQQESIDHCIHVLKTLTIRPTLWSLPEFKQVRECILELKTKRDQFAPMVGDSMAEVSTAGAVEMSVALTTNYVRSIAEYHDVDVDLTPILQVLSATMAFENASEGKKSNAMHFTQQSTPR